MSIYFSSMLVLLFALVALGGVGFLVYKKHYRLAGVCGFVVALVFIFNPVRLTPTKNDVAYNYDTARQSSEVVRHAVEEEYEASDNKEKISTILQEEK